MGSSIMYLYTKFSKKLTFLMPWYAQVHVYIRGFIIILKSFFFANSSSNSLKCKIFVSSAKWKLWNVWWIYLNHLCINRKRKILRTESRGTSVWITWVFEMWSRIETNCFLFCRCDANHHLRFLWQCSSLMFE